jgi:hypothetical protein
LFEHSHWTTDLNDVAYVLPASMVSLITTAKSPSLQRKAPDFWIKLA